MIRCMGCMKEYEDAPVCPHCGYVRGTAAREAYHLAPESILNGRYIVGRVLGFGGFGVTYIGYDAQLDRTVAIKEFLPTAFATRMPGATVITVYEGNATAQFGFGLDRFVQEAQRLAQFNGYAGITDIYDTFTANNTAYIVMQFLDGSDIKQVLAKEGPIPYERARDIILRVCDALAPVHARGIIHRDISPDNIFLTADGDVQLLDFGAARYESSVNSKSLSVILKSGYAPEEQYRSKGDQGPWTDIYALAATFYKMLTGVTPPDSMERAIKDEIVEPAKMGVAMPKSAENALMNALNIRKADRTQSVQAFREALEADGIERVKVKQEKKQSTRMPPAAMAAIAIVAVLAVVFLVLTATGTLKLSGKGAVEDNFGAVGDAGEVLVPDLTGLSTAEAKSKIEALGLTYEVAMEIGSFNLKEGQVAQQDPLPGRYTFPDETVRVAVCVGGIDDMLAKNPTNLPAQEAMKILSITPDKFGGFDDDDYNQMIYVNIQYDFSDTVAEGCVIRYKNAGSSSMDLWVSAGKNDVTEPFGALRGLFLDTRNTGGYSEMFYAIGMPADTVETEKDGYTEPAPRGILTFAVSTDGGNTYQPLLNRDTQDAVTQAGSSRMGGSYERNDLSGLLTFCSTSITFLIAEERPDLAGVPLKIRVQYCEAVENENYRNQPGRVLQTCDLEQTFMFEYSGTMPAVTGGEVVPLAEVHQLAQDETTGNGPLWRYAYIAENSNNDPAMIEKEMTGYTVYRFFGEFVEGQTYDLYIRPYRGLERYDYEYNEIYHVLCVKNGELLFMYSTGYYMTIVTGDRSSFTFRVKPNNRDEAPADKYDENNNILMRFRKPTQACVVYSKLIPGWDGSPTLAELVATTPLPEYNENVVNSGTNPVEDSEGLSPEESEKLKQEEMDRAEKEGN